MKQKNLFQMETRSWRFDTLAGGACELSCDETVIQTIVAPLALDSNEDGNRLQEENAGIFLSAERTAIAYGDPGNDGWLVTCTFMGIGEEGHGIFKEEGSFLRRAESVPDAVLFSDFSLDFIKAPQNACA